MIIHLLKSINDNQLTHATLGLLLIYIHNNDVKTQSQLISRLINEQFKHSNKRGYLYCLYNEVYI